MATVITARNTAQDRAAGVCKDLDGILDLGDKDLPVGVKASDLRLCNGHPNGVNITFDPAQGASLAPFQAVDALPLSLANTNVALKPEENNPLVARACYKDAQYGCSGGYCWKQCGNVQRGEWCWTAYAVGTGAWRTCSSWQECGTNAVTYGCGVGVGASNGCGC